jgi:hypothetical protein
MRRNESMSARALVEGEVLAELAHRGAQRDQVPAHVRDAVADLRLQRPRSVGVMGLKRGRRPCLRHRSEPQILERILERFLLGRAALPATFTSAQPRPHLVAVGQYPAMIECIEHQRR